MQSAEKGETAGKLLEPGDMFGDYTVEKLLGKGGMGAVYLVRAPDGERYAVKVMFPDMMKKGSDYRKRFAREAEFAMKIRHKNLISVYDVGEDPDTGLCYIIMDYVPGGSVADRIEHGGPLPMAEAVAIAAQVAIALDVAHQHGVIHRDIKPDNIMFDADGTPKLADLGVAKFTDGAHKTTVTTTGMIIGTPAYMAPEQMMDSHHIDARADIYALGVVLYEMLTGKRPNADSTAVELLAKAIKGEPLPDVRTMRPEVSAAVAHVLSLMCAPKPEGRPATALEAAQLLQKAVTGRLVLPKKPPRAADASARKKKRRLSLAVLAATLGVVALCATVAVVSLGKLPAKGQPQSQIVVVTNVVERKVVVTNLLGQAMSKGDKDRRVRYEKVGEYTWYYTVEGGDAVIGRGELGFDRYTRPAIDPMPRGEVVVPRSLGGRKVRAIGSQAFFRCKEMTAVIIPQGIVELRMVAFFECKNLRSVTLPPDLQQIGRRAFDYCPELSAIDVGECKDFLGESFEHCPRLERVAVSPTNSRYVESDGVVYTKDRRKLVFYPRTRPEFALPPGVVSIGDGACEGCVFRRKLSLPRQIEEIGKFAFAWCNGLEEISCEGRLKEVGEFAFSYCSGLNRVVFSSNLERVGRTPFAGCDRLRTVAFRGDAPTADFSATSFFGKAPDEVEILVMPGSKGWSARGSTELPKRWPQGAFADSRPVRASGDSDAGRRSISHEAKGAIDETNGKKSESALDSKNDVTAVVPYESKSNLHALYRSKDRSHIFVETSHSHGGSGFSTPPYSLARIKEMISTGTGIVHFHVSRSKDGVLFSSERSKLENISNGMGNVSDYTAQDLKKMKVKWQGSVSSAGFATCEEIIKAGRGKMLFDISGAEDYPREIEDLLDRLDAWESVILEGWNVADARRRYGKSIWRKIRSGEVQIMVGDRDLPDWRKVTPECMVWGWNLDLAERGLTNIPERVACGFVYGSGSGLRTDDEKGWAKAISEGVTILRTNRPKELLAYLERRTNSRDEAGPGDDGKKTPSAMKTSLIFPSADPKDMKWKARSPWRYVTKYPASSGGNKWTEPAFRDSGWKRTNKPLGAGKSKEIMRIADRWSSSSLYLRRHFAWKGGKVARVEFTLYHACSVKIYLNGDLVLEKVDRNDWWEKIEISVEAFAAALRDGDNVLAVEAEDNFGTRYFDCGLTVEAEESKRARCGKGGGIPCRAGSPRACSFRAAQDDFCRCRRHGRGEASDSASAH